MNTNMLNILLFLNYLSSHLYYFHKSERVGHLLSCAHWGRPTNLPLVPIQALWCWWAADRPACAVCPDLVASQHACCHNELRSRPVPATFHLLLRPVKQVLLLFTASFYLIWHLSWNAANFMMVTCGELQEGWFVVFGEHPGFAGLRANP